MEKSLGDENKMKKTEDKNLTQETDGFTEDKILEETSGAQVEDKNLSRESGDFAKETDNLAKETRAGEKNLTIRKSSVKNQNADDAEIDRFLPEYEKIRKEVGKIAASSTEEEFSATKKNGARFMWKNVWRWILIVFALMGIITFAVTKSINNKNKKIEVNVEDFSSIDLKNLLNQVGTLEEHLKSLRLEKSNLEAQKLSDTKSAETERNNSLATLETLNLRKSERNQREKTIEEKYQNAIQEISLYDEKIQKVETEISEYEEKLRMYDSDKVQQANEQKAAMASERFLYETEKNSLVSNYENKLGDSRRELEQTKKEDLARQNELVAYVISQYDPPISNNLERQVRSSNSYSDNYSASSNLSSDASQNFKSAVQNQKSYYDSISNLEREFSIFPQKKSNAIQSYVLSISKTAKHAGTELVNASVSEVNSLIDEKNELQNQNALLQKDNEEILKNLCVGDVNGIILPSISKSAQNFSSESFSGENSESASLTEEYRVYVSDVAKLYFYGENAALEKKCDVLHGGKVIASGYVKNSGDDFSVVLTEKTQNPAVCDGVVIKRPSANSQSLEQSVDEAM